MFYIYLGESAAMTIVQQFFPLPAMIRLSWTFGLENYLSIQNVSNRLGCQDVINHNKKLWSSAESSDKYTLFNTPVPQTWTFCTALAINLSGGSPEIRHWVWPASDGSTRKWWWINTIHMSIGIFSYFCQKRGKHEYSGKVKRELL